MLFMRNSNCVWRNIWNTTLNPDNCQDEMDEEMDEMFQDFKSSVRGTMDISFITESIFDK